MTDGYVRRWQVLDFPHLFSEKMDVMASIPPQEWANEAKKVIGIMGRLWKEREFTNQGTIADRRLAYESKSNPLMLFIREQTLRNPDGHILAYEFREMFQKYCQDRGMRQWSDVQIGRRMKDAGYEHERVGQNRYWAYLGIVWLPQKGQGQMTMAGAMELEHPQGVVGLESNPIHLSDHVHSQVPIVDRITTAPSSCSLSLRLASKKEVSNLSKCPNPIQVTPETIIALCTIDGDVDTDIQEGILNKVPPEMKATTEALVKKMLNNGDLMMTQPDKVRVVR
jgi:hypothetical protein